MVDDSIVILHVFQDGLIFSGVANSYDSLKGVKNLYYYFSSQKDFKLQNIKDERVKIISDFNEYTDYFSSPEIDVIVFHGLPNWVYYLFNYIDDKKFVIWWAWGYDIYYKQGKYPPLIAMEEMLMPKTKRFVIENIEGSNGSITETINNKLGKVCSIPARIIRKIINRKNLPPRTKKTQEEILERIDSFYSPLDIEYDLIRQFHPTFNAKRNPKVKAQQAFEFVMKKNPGNILVNHSLTHTDNHLDVFDYLYSVNVEKHRKFIMPISYGIGGNYNGNQEILINAAHFEPDQVVWLTKTLPFNEYKEIIDTVSHAVFGALRQQALGNIYMCLRRGVKIYLFKNSMIYKELKKSGYVCFTIEDDLNTESLSSCLSEKEAKKNYDIFVKIMKENNSEKFREFLVNAIAEKQGR